VLRCAALVVVPAAAACSLVESFEGYSDEWGREAGVAVGGSTATGGGAGWPGTGGGSAAGGVAGSDAACSADVSSDPENCGACGHRCEDELGPLSTCSAGTCSCPAATIQCGNRCTRTESDPENCGSCGTVVDPAEYCVGGAPTCRPRTSLCKTWTTTQGYTVSCSGFPKCTDHKWDGSHCVGTSGGKSRCYSTASDEGHCIDGKCEYNGTCPSGRLECPSTLSNVWSCFDPMNDSNHCGACANPCAAGETCVQGSCVQYSVVQDCSECGSKMNCCGSLPSVWAHGTICVAATGCPG